MEHIVRSLKTLWHTERILGKNEFRLMVKKLQLNLLPEWLPCLAW